jgi:hypothetical protein
MLQHVLVGLDGSPLAESTLVYVEVLAKALAADVTLLHVLSRPQYAIAGTEAIAQAKGRAKGYLEEVKAHVFRKRAWSLSQ